jgi:hypothetical protein
MAFKQGRRNDAIGLALVFAGFTMGSSVMVHQSARSVLPPYTMTAAGIATLIHYRCGFRSHHQHDRPDRDIGLRLFPPG